MKVDAWTQNNGYWDWYGGLGELAGFLDNHTESRKRYGLAQLVEEFLKALLDRA